ncbi:MAG: hypothetical protein HY815_04740 [Candidatus Riflebacteria bacterium]|nr:hypothetical protein [Candidatus Riflebacteria bacterium]
MEIEIEIRQSCCDAAALAACTKLPDGVAAEAKAREYCALNGVIPSEIATCRTLPLGSLNPNRYEVVLIRTAGPFFTAVLGVGTVRIGARSVAVADVKGTGSSGSTPGPSALDFAVYSAREFTARGRVDEVALTGNGFRINGDLHVNGDFKVTGGGATFNGKVEAGHDVKDAGAGATYLGGPPVEDADKVPLVELDLADVKAKAAAEGHYYKWDAEHGRLTTYNPSMKNFQPCDPPPGASVVSGNLKWEGSSEVINGTFYLEGMGVQMSGSSLDGKATFVAEGEIKISGTNYAYKDTAQYAFVSLSTSAAAVDISGSNSTFYGAVYAPNGTVSFSGNDLTFNGAVLANNIQTNLAGTNMTINYDPNQTAMIPVKAASTETFIRLAE